MRINTIKLIVLLILSAGLNVVCEESSQYLENVVNDLHLRMINSKQPLRRSDASIERAASEADDLVASTSIKLSQRNEKNMSPPPLSLTKGELAALYEAAITKGETIKLDTGDNSYVHAAVHELDDSASDSSNSKPNLNGDAPPNEGDASGYYYYYYPIKSFLDEMISQTQPSESHVHPGHTEVYHHEPTQKPQYSYHSHHHHHDVNISSVKEMEDKKKAVGSPLFMAISGFIGMALMFVFSVLMFPKFSIKKKGRDDIKKHPRERINDLARIAFEAIEGGDCTERFACELGKSARNFNFQENRFVKLIKRMAPGTFGKQMDKIGRYSNKRIKCTAIPCKKKNNNNNNNNNQKKKQNQKKH